MGFSDIFGGGGGDSPQLLQPAWMTELQEALGKAAKPGALNRINRAGEPYPGDLTAGLSEFEGMGYEKLMDYLNRPGATESDLFQSARGEIMKTLEGGYDPGESEYYKAYKTNMMRELQEAKDRLNASTSARDKYFGGGRIAVAGELEETAVGELQQILGLLYERERERRLNAVPEAMRMATYEEMAPLSRIEAALGYGQGERDYRQQGLDREYSEWQRQLTDLGIPLDVAMGLATYKPDYYIPQSGAGNMAGFGDLAGAIASIYATNKKGG